MSQVVAQKLNKKESSELNVAIRYFSILSAISNIHLTQKQIELLAFTAVKGTISSGGARQDFIDHFSSSKGTLENLKHSLVKKGFIVKIDGKYKIAPSFEIDFKKKVVLQLNLEIYNGEPENRENKDTEAS